MILWVQSHHSLMCMNTQGAVTCWKGIIELLDAQISVHLRTTWDPVNDVALGPHTQRVQLGHSGRGPGIRTLKRHNH